MIVFDLHGAAVAEIVLQPRIADTYRAHEPWLLLWNSGRIDRFAHQREAKAEARKSWPRCQFQRPLRNGSKLRPV